eukprot:CAMPEP_0185203130 /NCGR_PEP_ID=MMETSP1140-20130426/52398_1 /TAXON_ID=298111 /ORGANISM="Pavlova sp., Strain CCMP459" /LENGTH=200 /DNA_ID=CAMNT_0027770615 /DNA_START=90 /DNA_END=689 /DNA_ORIENTATION=+
MRSVASQGESDRDAWRQGLAIVAGAAGQIFEWYDFALFGLLAPEIGDSFFSPADEHTQLLRAFAVWGSAFFARQAGGVLFGWIGDKKGRLVALRVSIVMMAVPVAVIAVLPSYEQWGIASSIALVATRLLQGVSVGGELAGAISYALESVPGRPGLLGAFIQISGSIGGLLAAAVVAILHRCMSAEAMHAHGWRLAFALG